MTRINTNVGSLIAQSRLNKTNNDLQTALTRLSTGLKINTGKDDPAGLIASEALRSDITSINKALSNTQRANQIIATADSALGQVSSLLNDIRGLVIEASNKGALSDEEIAANQLQVDSSLEAINRIAQTTTFQGRRLLDGSLDFVTKQGAGYSTVADLKIDSANLGATGSVSVDVQIQTAATKASISTTGIPGAATAVNASASLSFQALVADAEASGTIALANAYTIGNSATAAISFANATTPNAEASGELVLTGGVSVELTAVDGSAVDGTVGNNVKINITVSGTATTSSGTYDVANNELNLTLVNGQNGADLLTDLAADTNLASYFSFAAATGTPTSGTTSAGDNGTYFSVLSGGTDSTSATTGFDLTAVDGGRADGLRGNDTEIFFTTGATTAATYDNTNNRLNVTVAANATIANIATAINTTLGDDFSVTNVVNGSYKFSASDNTPSGSPLGLAGGTNTTTPAAFTLEAKNGGRADGTKGNATQLNFTAGTTSATTATYDVANDQINILVGTNATVDDIVNAINTDLDDDFIASGPLAGTSFFGSTDLGTSASTLSGGTNANKNDVITVTADDSGTSLNGKTISLVQDNSIATGAATASVLTDGNIEVRIKNSGNVNISTIAGAINNLDGISASVTTNDGDGIYSIGTDTAPTITAFANGAAGGGLIADLVIKLTGGTGSEVLQFKKGASVANLVQSINLVKDATGVEAVNDAGALKLSSTTYGSKGLVDVEVISEGTGGTFGSQLSSNRALGKDIVATVNGVTAGGDGNTLSINTATLDLSLTVSDGSSTSVSFTITGGGALFQLGPDVVSNQQARLGIGSLNTAKLGGASGRLYELASGGTKALSTNATEAARVVDEVIGKVTTLRGRLGAFQRTTLESNTVALSDTVSNLYEAESSIRDADFAKESAALTRAQILVQSGTAVLGIANQNPQNVLGLLR
jgi:flagellin